MRITYLLITLAVLAGCKAETTSETAILGITVPANMSGIPSSN
jgi:hypothetical protein